MLLSRFLDRFGARAGRERLPDVIDGTPDRPQTSEAKATLFIASAYCALLGRPPDKGGFSHYFGRLKASSNETDVVLDLQASDEFRQRWNNGDIGSSPAIRTALVRDLYRGFLDREADPGGLEDYASRLAAGLPVPDLIGLLVGSDEYRNRLDRVETQLSGMAGSERKKRLLALSQVPPNVAWPVEDQTMRCIKAPAPRGETALVVSHSPDGSLKPHVEHLLRALLGEPMAVILVVQSDRSFCNIDQEFVDRLSGIFVRQNRGYDFAAWAHVLRESPALLDVDRLFLINDSLIGPTNAGDFAVFLNRMRHHPTDLVGVTDSYEGGWHLQSFFLLLKRPALRHDAFRAFVSGVVAFGDKRDVIDTYERPLAPLLRESGLSCGVLFETDAGTTDNPTLYRWRELLQGGFPFVKIMAIRDRFDRIDSSDWRVQLADRGYEVALADTVLGPIYRQWSALGAMQPLQPPPDSLRYRGLLLPDPTSPDPTLLEPASGQDGTWMPPPLVGIQPSLVSFDVWNTVIHRDCHPDEIKLQSARYLLLTAHGDLRPAYQDLLTLFRARLNAENRSAPHGDFEYRFSEAVSVWLDDALVGGTQTERRAALAEALLAHEFQAECRSTRPDSRLRGYLSTLSTPAIFVSDFYLSAHVLRDVLGHHGLAGSFVKGYSSCDSYLNKRGGRLFAAVLDDLQLEPRGLLHIGDNAIADVAVPNALGIITVRYENHAEERLHAWYGQAFHGFSGGDGDLHARRVEALLDQQAELALDGPAATSGTALRALGIRHAPLVFSFCLHVLEEALKSGDQTVFFFTREGVLLRQVFDSIVMADPYGTRAVQSRLLSVSRMATFAASMDDGSIEEMMRLWTMYSNQSIEALSTSLGLAETLMKAASERLGLNYQRAIHRPWRDRDFLRFWSDPEVQDHIALQIGAQRQRLTRYLEQAGFGVGRNAPRVVDIGWRGSIQDNLSRLLKRRTEGHYLALLPYLNAQPVGSRKHGWLSDANRPTRFLLEDQVAPLEMLLNTPGGSVTGYEERDGAMVPLTKLLEEEDRVAIELAPYREGLLSAIPALCRYIRLHGLTAESLLGLSRGIAAGIISTPPAVLADLFADLSHNELFGTGRVHRVGGDVDLGEILAQEHGPDLHQDLSSWLKQARWHNGAVRQSAVADWYRHSSFKQRIAVPLAVNVICAPAVQAVRGERLAVYVPAPLAASGGHRTIFNTVRRLARVGLRPHVYVAGGRDLDIVEDYLGSTTARIERGWRGDVSCAFALATIANSAQFVSHNVDAAHKCYLVQDAEALFNPIGDAYVVAENSYAQGLIHFTIGNWLTHVINTRFGAPAIPAGLGVDVSVYHPRADIARKPALCMLYQPEKPRRGNNLGLQALRIVKRMRPAVEIFVYGSDTRIDLNVEVEQLGVITDLHELNVLYNTCVAGLCISLSNPSRIPFEMAAAGCMPIDVYRHNNLFDYAEGNAILAYQSAESLASALISALDAQDDVATRNRLIASMDGRTLDWEGDAIAAAVLEIARGTPIPSWPLSPSYTAEPHLAASDRTSSIVHFCKAERRMSASS